MATLVDAIQGTPCPHACTHTIPPPPPEKHTTPPLLWCEKGSPLWFYFSRKKRTTPMN